MKFTHYFLLTILLIGLNACRTDKTTAPPEPEYLGFTYKGLNAEASQEAVPIASYDDFVATNANAVSLSPRAILPGGSDSIEFDRSGFAWGETSNGIAKQIKDAREKGVDVLIAPWVEFPPAMDSETFDAGTTEAWTNFNTSYLEYILHFAELAEQEGASVFSIGSNMENYVKDQEVFWFQLIDSVKTRFSGQLTYSANWKNYDDIPFWEELSYIGIEAYWSVSLSRTPSVENVEQYWEINVIPELVNFGILQQKTILFTKLEYRSIDFAGEKPWDSEIVPPSNEEAQANCLRGFLDAFRSRSWFEGAFVGRWSFDQSDVDAADGSYGFRGKEAENFLQEVYLDSL